MRIKMTLDKSLRVSSLAGISNTQTPIPNDRNNNHDVQDTSNDVSVSVYHSPMSPGGNSRDEEQQPTQAPVSSSHMPDVCDGTKTFPANRPRNEKMSTSQPLKNDSPIGAKATWTKFAGETTLHGGSKLVDTKRRKCSKCCWLLLMLLGFSLLQINFVSLIGDYRRYNTITRTFITVKKVINFPKVTICNLCPYKDSRPNSSSSQDEAARSYFISSSEYTHLFLKNDTLTKIFQERIMKTDDQGKSVLEASRSYQFTAKDLFLYGHFGKETFHNMSEVFQEVETVTGRCFVFNGPDYVKRHGKPRQVTTDGRDSGLVVAMNIRQDQYFVFHQLTAGVRIFLTDQLDKPRYTKDGIDVRPGTSNRISVFPVKYTFLPDPYISYGSKSCVEIPDPTDQQLVKKMVNSTFYSFTHCMFQCRAKKVSIECRCSSHLLYIKGLEECNTKLYIQCFFPKLISHDGEDCDCPRPCSFRKFGTSLTSSQWPSRVSESLLMPALNYTSIQQLRDNHLEVRINFDSMLMREEKHHAEFTLASIISLWGGQMGFFLGASVLTVIEIWETILTSIYLFLHQRICRTPSG